MSISVVYISEGKIKIKEKTTHRNNFEIDWGKLARYFSGEATPEEKEEIEKWISNEPFRVEIIKMLKKMWDLAGKDSLKIDVEKAWSKLNLRIADEEHKDTKIRRYLPMGRKAIHRFVGVFLVLFLCFAFIVYLVHNRNAGKLTVHEISTGKGQMVNLRLIDGTRVKLNSKTVLKVPGNYEDKREVYLSGEAYFEVKQFKNLKFIVKTDRATVEVLGTKFNVSAYPEDKKVRVFVSEGKVALYPNSVIGGDKSSINRAILQRGQVAYAYDGKVTIPQFVDPKYELAWLESEVRFNNTPLSEVIKYLERKYNVKCTASDSSILKLRFTGSFRLEKIDEILSIISLALKLRYNYSDGLVVFDYKNKNSKIKQRR